MNDSCEENRTYYMIKTVTHLLLWPTCVCSMLDRSVYVMLAFSECYLDLCIVLSHFPKAVFMIMSSRTKKNANHKRIHWL